MSYKNGVEKSYKVELGLKHYENSTLLSFGTELRERHLTRHTKKVEVSAFGEEILVEIDSVRDHIVLAIPSTEWTFVEISEKTMKGRGYLMIPLNVVDDFLPDDDSIVATVDVLETSDGDYYDEEKITYDQAGKYVERFERKYSELRSQIRAKDVINKMGIVCNKHNTHRITEELDKRYESVPGATKRYKL